jgi:hypothetical protein
VGLVHTSVNRLSIVASSPMSVTSTLAAPDLRKVVVVFADLLASHKEVINRLNVYPVPDGDTGTNMTLTIESVAAEIDELGADPTDGRGLQGHRPRFAHGCARQLRASSSLSCCAASW